MWTAGHRKMDVRDMKSCPSSVTDREWSVLEPLIPPATPGGRPRKTDMREAINAIFYLLRTGCPWRYLPRDGFPARSTVYNIFRKFQREGYPCGVGRSHCNGISPSNMTRQSHAELCQSESQFAGGLPAAIDNTSISTLQNLVLS